MDAVLAPTLVEWVRAAMPLQLPAAVQQAQHELASLTELSAGRKPYAALVHCLCTAP